MPILAMTVVSWPKQAMPKIIEINAFKVFMFLLVKDRGYIYINTKLEKNQVLEN